MCIRDRSDQSFVLISGRRCAEGKGKTWAIWGIAGEEGRFLFIWGSLWSDAFRRSNGFCQSCLVWVSGRESDDSVFVGLWNKGDFSGDAVFSAAVLFLPSRLAVVFLFCHADGAESLGKQKEGKSRLPCLFFLSLRCSRVYSSGYLAGKLC